MMQQQRNGHAIIRVQSQASLGGLCGGQTGIRLDSPLSILILPCD
jgi:hypothetical protein